MIMASKLVYIDGTKIEQLNGINYHVEAYLYLSFDTSKITYVYDY